MINIVTVDIIKETIFKVTDGLKDDWFRDEKWYDYVMKLPI